MAFCAKCGADVTGVRFCASCGAPVDASGPAPGYTAPSPGQAAYTTAAPSDGGLTDNVAGALAYVTIIPAILFLLIDPFKTRRFVRFHSFQNLFFTAALFVIWIGYTVLSTILSFAGVGFVLWMLYPVIMIAEIVIWVLLVVKAYQGQEYKLPIIGDLAAKQA